MTAFIVRNMEKDGHLILTSVDLVLFSLLRVLDIIKDHVFSFQCNLSIKNTILSINQAHFAPKNQFHVNDGN
jgi:hypothetical protein